MIRCPQCGNNEDFAIDAVEYVTAYVTQALTDTEWNDAGVLEVTDSKGNGGTEWDDDSGCRCLTCQHTATLGAFEIPATLIDASLT